MTSGMREGEKGAFLRCFEWLFVCETVDDGYWGYEWWRDGWIARERVVEEGWRQAGDL